MLERLATGLAATRVAFGLGYLAAPDAAASGWIGRTARREPAKLLARGFGVRDLVLGAGALYALADRRVDPRPWFLAQAVAEASDCLTTIATPGRLPRSGYLVGVGLTSASTAIALAAAIGLRGAAEGKS